MQGLTLHDQFKDLIAKYGGRDKLANDIESEWIKIKVIRNLNQDRIYKGKETDYIIANYQTKSAKEIATVFHRPLKGLQNKIYKMHKAGLLPFKQVHTS